MEVYLDGIKSDLGGHKVIRTFDAVKQILGKQQKRSDFVCRKNEYSSQTLYWAQALASFVNNGASGELYVLCCSRQDHGW